MTDHLRFSIVVPAHNEEAYLHETLARIRAIDYPAGYVEAIVVENGSTDRTFEIAQSYAGDTIRVIRSDKGVSRARNAGVAAASPKSDWIIFLDADTQLAPSFLAELDAFIRSSEKTYSVGTCSILPYPDSRTARLWFSFYDIGHRITKTSYALFFAKRSLFPAIRFDEARMMGEDLEVIRQARMHGAFFFLPTRSVMTSTRRFEQIGWWRIFFSWTFVALLPASIQRKMRYRVVR